MAMHRSESSEHVVAVCSSPTHSMSKFARSQILLLQGLGVAGDVHMGAKVTHRYSKRRDPGQPNLCQVHLLHSELLAELRTSGFHLVPGQIGENITTRAIDLLGMPLRTRLHLGPTAVVELTGLRTPCVLLNKIQPGLMAATRMRQQGRTTFKAGVMSIVLVGGEVRPGDPICVELPPEPFEPLEPV